MEDTESPKKGHKTSPKLEIAGGKGKKSGKGLLELRDLTAVARHGKKVRLANRSFENDETCAHSMYNSV
jgi:hypothetical protein